MPAAPGSPSPSLYPLRGGLPCGQIKSPVWLQGLAVNLLEQYFGCPERIALESSKFLWNPDPLVSRVYINIRDNFDPVTVGKRPAIIVGLGEQSYPQKMIGDLMAVDRFTGTKTFHDLIEGTWEFACMGEGPLEALALASEIKYFLGAHRHPVADKYGFQMLRMSGIGKYVKQPEYRDAFGCLATAAYSIEDNFTLDQMALKVSAFRLKLAAT